MSQFTVDTEQLKNDYPFLDKIWKLYEEFNETAVNSNDGKDDSVSMCEQFMQEEPDKKEWYTKLCIKLIRILGAFSFMKNKDKYNPERCKILNSWLYYIIKNNYVNQDVITNIFDQSNKVIGEGNEEHHCSNYLYKDKYDDPDDIIKLINFEEYKNDILKILKDNKNDNHCSCLKFIFECANIYRKMNNIYCISPTGDTSKKPNTCSKLQDFYTFYTSNIYGNVEIKGKLPSLDVAENEHIPPCPSDIENQEPRRVPSQALGSGLRPEPQPQDISDSVEQSGSTIPLNGTAIVGTMFGIPPFLALIYKFTPVGVWFRSKNKKSTDVFKNLDEAIEKKLYIPRHDNAIINSSHARYNVAYEQM
ncbi:unnamed protein product [Plasmodium vivax]|uniref:(malaria parasite P. vivax) hypothetical protein n=1 Tax=Plasmodium vivax TaxID=5855 RepID=A0A8S4H859_PLAVI|nr:unnamed protein product [Plasmodium vivax]